MNVTKQDRRARAAPAGSRSHVRAFTLVEMLAVMAVMGIMFGVAVIGFNAFGRGARLRSATQMISRHLTYARQLAMTKRAQYGVEFHQGDPQRFRVYDGSGDETVGQWIELPLGIKYGTGAQSPPGKIEFLPTGRAEGIGGDLEVYIHDVDSGKQRLIEVVPITGHTKTD